MKSGGERELTTVLVCRVCCGSRVWDTASSFLGTSFRGGKRRGNGRIRLSSVGGRQANQTERKVGHQAVEPRCYGCNRAGHVRRDCQVRCFLCNELGHMRRNCPNQIQGNGQGGQFKSELSPCWHAKDWREVERGADEGTDKHRLLLHPGQRSSSWGGGVEVTVFC